jgi:hypothetical protein
MHPYNLQVEHRHSATITQPKSNRRTPSSPNTYSLNKRTQTEINYTLGVSKITQLDIKSIVEHLNKFHVPYVLRFQTHKPMKKHVTKPKKVQRTILIILLMYNF